VQETYARLLQAREAHPVHSPRSFLFATGAQRRPRFLPPPAGGGD